MAEIAIAEKALMVDVLRRAVKDSLGQFEFYKGCYSDKQQALITEEARDWIADEWHGAAQPFTFEWICEALEVDPVKVRENISKLSPKERLETIRSPTVLTIERQSDALQWPLRLEISRRDTRRRAA